MVFVGYGLVIPEAHWDELKSQRRRAPRWRRARRLKVNAAQFCIMRKR
jgi:hypothetical protein